MTDIVIVAGFIGLFVVALNPLGWTSGKPVAIVASKINICRCFWCR